MQPAAGVHQRLGAVLRELRLKQGFSVRTLAAKVGFSPSFISQIESDAASPSIASLEKIGAALGVTLGQLFSSLEQTAKVRMVVRQAERTTYTSTWSQTTVTVLSDFSPQRGLSAVELVMAPGGMSSRGPEARAQDTFASVTAGSLTLLMESGDTLLESGDSVYIPAGTAFAWANRGATPVTLLLVGTSGRIDFVKDVLARATSADAAP
jgi:transcriptional regulator with XRE-family HTH domain